MKITENSFIKQNISIKPVDLNGQLAMLNVTTGKYIVLNSVGTRIWALAAEGICVVDLVRLLVDEFDITYDLCKQDVIPYLKILKKARLIELG